MRHIFSQTRVLKSITSTLITRMGRSVACLYVDYCTLLQVTAEDVVRAVYRGFERGKKDFGVEARSILCCIRGHDAWNDDVLALGKRRSNW